MKKITRNSKHGFTLLEVLLATVIMVVASTMIMKGFIAVMIFARNNRNFSGSGQRDTQLAIHNTLVNYGTSGNQINTITALRDGTATKLSLEFDPSHAAAVTLPALYVDLETYGDPQVPVFDSTNPYVIDGDSIDTVTSSNNRFAFFYDFGDYIGASNFASGCIPRWGYMFSQTQDTDAGYDTPIYVDKNNNGLVGADEPDDAVRASELVGYGRYGWYCFNATHVNEDGSPMSCRCNPMTPSPVS
ncbi:MAG: type II secretion system GspH family protein [Saccharofermentans sp.]|nr:type II secretion system GspH family protein [Saccharofermentans sp.]